MIYNSIIYNSKTVELNDKQFYISYMIGILIAILFCSGFSVYYSYITNEKVEKINATLDQWELTK